MARASGVAVSWLAPAGALGVAVAAALPWAHSGRRAVSGYDLAGVARTFGLADRALLSAAATAWLCLPVAAATSVAAAALGRRALAAVVALAVSLAGLSVALLMVRAARGASAGGARLTIVAGVAGVIGAAVALTVRSRSVHPSSRSRKDPHGSMERGRSNRHCS